LSCLPGEDLVMSHHHTDFGMNSLLLYLQGGFPTSKILLTHQAPH
jgi:hypothetical protein